MPRTVPGRPDLSDDEGIRQAWAAHGDELLGYAVHALGDRAAAEEAVQETFVRAWRAAGRYDRSRPLRPWLFAILRHVVVDQARSRSVRPAPAAARDGEQGAEAAVGDQVETVLDRWLVEEGLRRIRDDQRTVLVETYYRGRTYAEVAAELGIPEGTARSRAFYALRALRLALEELGWDR
jgi:RNA polymerase sigma-70 factor (ECF subfamily)